MIDRLPRNTPRLLLAVGLVASAAVTLILVRHLTFFGDSWEFLMNRRHLTATAVFEPHNEHIVVIPVLLTQLFLRVFGMTSVMPEFALLTVGLLALAALLFEYVRRRIGPWPALYAALLVLFLGPAFEVLLWTFEISYVGAMVFGLAMLLALEARTRRMDILACASLVLCFGFCDIGISFTVAAFVLILLGPRETWRGRAFVFVVPAVLYALWWLGWGHNAETHLTLHNVLDSPSYVAEAMSIGVGALTGLGTNGSNLVVEATWGRIFLVALVIGFGILIRNRRYVHPSVWPVAAAALTNWLLTAFSDMPGREAGASRYQYLSAVFILMIIASLLHGTRIGKRALVVAGAVTVLILGPNLVVLHKGREFFAEQTIFTRSDTAALQIARPRVSPDFSLNAENAGTASLVDINAQKYFEAIDEFGSPAYSEAELETAQPQGRHQADILLFDALPISSSLDVNGYGAAAAARPGCVDLGGPESKMELKLTSRVTRIEVPPGTEAAASLRRFSGPGEFPVGFGKIPSRSTLTFHIPTDESPLPWYLHVESTRTVRVCG